MHMISSRNKGTDTKLRKRIGHDAIIVVSPLVLPSVSNCAGLKVVVPEPCLNLHTNRAVLGSWRHTHLNIGFLPTKYIRNTVAIASALEIDAEVTADTD